MDARNLEQLIENTDALELSQIVYEAEDEGMMLYFNAIKNTKSYHSKVTIDWSALNFIIGRFAKMGLDIYEEVSEKLFNNSSRFREYQFDNNINLSESGLMAA